MGMEPTARQRDFLEVQCEEVLFGGAAGGGKSEALLMWLAEGVHVPSYSGIVFRRTYAQLEKSNESLVAKSQRMYRGLGGEYNASGHFWRFPSGARIEFGHLQHATSIYDYQGPAFHRCAFDELTQFTEDQYLFMFSRQRATTDFPLPMGTRATANPGGSGHGWVKRRFISQEALSGIRGLDYREPSKPGLMFRIGDDRVFVPSRLADNPHLKFNEYVANLRKLNPIECERLLNGDWSIAEGLIFPEEWLRYYGSKGEMIGALDDNRRMGIVEDCRRFKRFATIDT
ncbi:MAG: terminase large subunit domain-containing protein, partial [Pyrinomonadaceae bacterium]